MRSKIVSVVAFVACVAFTCTAPQHAGAQPPPAPDKSVSKAKSPAAGPPRGGPVFGEVNAVRGNVLQMRTPDRQGMTRVVLASDAKIIRDEVVKVDTLKPGTKVTGAGVPVEGTGIADVPLKVEVKTLSLEGPGGMGGLFFGGDAPGPLMRGQRSAIFHKNNYAGTIGFDAEVKSVNPLVLADTDGNPLPVEIGSGVEVHQRLPRPIRPGDITAGSQLMAMGSPTPDGLLSANMIILMSQGSARGSMTGTIMGVSSKGVTVRPRFEPRDLLIEILPAARLYVQERLDLDTIQVGDVLIFSGKVLNGTAKAPTAMVVQTISAVQADMPTLDDGGSGMFDMFGGGSVTARVKGKVTGFDPLRVETTDGREITMKVPGQLTYVRYRRVDRKALAAGKKVLCSGKSKPGGLSADTIIVNPAPQLGPGF